MLVKKVCRGCSKTYYKFGFNVIRSLYKLDLYSTCNDCASEFQMHADLIWLQSEELK